MQERSKLARAGETTMRSHCRATPEFEDTSRSSPLGSGAGSVVSRRTWPQAYAVMTAHTKNSTRCLRNMSFEEVAKDLQIGGAGTVSVASCRALRKLQGALAD